MSSGDLDDELLALAGDDEHKSSGDSKKRKQLKQSSSKTKRRRANDDSDGSTDEPDEVAMYHAKYPLEGLYTDEEERERLLALPEIEREEILAKRRDELQNLISKQQLADLLAANNGPGDHVSRAAKREHGVRGATKEKTRQLENLRAKRSERAEKRARGGSPRRDRSSSPMDMETDDEDEDGQIGRDEQEEERERRLLGGTSKSSSNAPTTKDDLNKIRLTRDLIARHFLMPWFKDYVKGTFVRYLIGNDNGRPIYRVCEVLSLSDERVKPYKVNDAWVDQEFELRHGEACKFWPMDKTSNAEFTDREFDRIVKVCKNDNVPFPGRDACEKKQRELKTHVEKPLTEADVNTMLQRKKALAGVPSANEQRLQRAELQQARNHAVKHNDVAEVQRLDQRLASLGVTSQPQTSAPVDDVTARLAKVNERNRKANMEAVRRIEHAEAERRRKERERRLASRTATPQAVGTPEPTAVTSSSVSKNQELSVLQDIEIDLGDF